MVLGEEVLGLEDTTYHPFCLLLLFTFLEKIKVFGVVPLVKLTWAILEIMGKGVVLEEEVL